MATCACSASSLGQGQEIRSSSAVMLIGCSVGSLRGSLEREQWELTASLAGQSRAGARDGQAGAVLPIPSPWLL